MKIRVFGKIAEIVGTSELEADSFPNTEMLRGYLYQQFPGLAHAKFNFAVNKKLVTGDAAIPQDAEVALLPPFSGG